MPVIVAAVTDVFFLAKIHDAIRQAGAEMRLARTAEEGLQHARQNPALVILDLNDRTLNAVALAEALKGDETLRGVPIVGFLSHVQADLKQKAQEAGVDEVLARSVFSSSLPAILQRYVG